MKIGFDGKRAANNLTGLGNYSRSLVHQLSFFFPQNQYLVYTPKVKSNQQVQHFFNAKNVVLKLPRVKTFFWRSLGIKNDLVEDQIDLFHGLSHEIPLGLSKIKIPAVVTIHDLIFLKFPEYFNPIDRLIYRLKCEYACKKADRIIAISERTKLDLVELLQVDEKKINVIYQTCDEAFKVQVSEDEKLSVADSFSLPPKFILNVGTIETRKNLLTLIKALPGIDESYKLVVVGKQTPYFQLVKEEIRHLNLESRVIFLDNVPFKALPIIYQLASVFCYPSIYEGFGIPIIEALYSGIPVVASTGSCLEEAGGPNSLYVSSLDHQGFSRAINEVINDAQLKIHMQRKGLEYVQKFDPKIVTEDLMEVYKKLIADKK